MITVSVISLILAVAGGIMAGVGASMQGQKETEARRAEAQYNIDQLDLQLENLADTYEANQADLLADYRSTRRANNQSIWATEAARGANAGAAAYLNTENQGLMYEELAALQRSGLQSIGSAVNQASLSGFRNTGSARNLVDETRRNADASYDQSRRGIQLSAYQGYMQASNDYFSANVQLESYRQSNRDALERFNSQGEALEMQYQYDRNRLQGERGYWQGILDGAVYTSEDAFADFASGW